MQFLAVVAIALLIVLGMTRGAFNTAHDNPQSATESVAEVDKYRMFMFVADQYMLNDASAPAGPAVITWAMMRQSKVTPPGAKELGMPGGWRVVRAADNSWVACTEMSERSAGAIAQLAPRPSTSAVSATTSILPQLAPVDLAAGGGGTSSYLVIGTPTSAVTLASLCNS